MEKVETAKGLARAFYRKRKLAVKEEVHLRAAVDRIAEYDCHSPTALVHSLLKSVSNSEDRV
jgi:hypothetical protein